MRIDAQRGLVVRLPNWLGDFVACEPAVRALHLAFESRGASERLALCAPARLLELFDGRMPHVRRLPSERGWHAWRGFGAALLLTGSWRSAYWALRAGATTRIGLARDGRSCLLTAATTPARERGRAALGVARVGRWPRTAPRPMGAVAAELVGSIGVPVLDAIPRLDVSAPARQEVGAFLDERVAAAAFALVNAGGRPGSAKSLRAAEWARVLVGLPATQHVVAAFGPGEEHEARALVDLLTSRGRRAHLAFEHRAPTLAEYLALLERCVRFLTTDTGPRHLARALRVPADVLFGPTDPRHTLEGAAPERYFAGSLECSPCHRERCQLEPARDRECLQLAARELGSAGW